MGGALRANFGISFGDMLGDRQLQTMLRVGTNKDDLAAQVAYVNQKRRLNWGFVGGFVPARFIGARRSIDRGDTLVTQESANLRYTHEFASLTARYNVSRATRFEFRGGARRTGYGWQTVTRVTDTTSRKLVSNVSQELPGAPVVYLAEMEAAYVRDTAVLGPTSPILGHRIRLDVEPALGGLMFADVRLDARRYFMPVRPVTFAMRLEHTGRCMARRSRRPLDAALARSPDVGARVRPQHVCRRAVWPAPRPAAPWSINSRAIASP